MEQRPSTRRQAFFVQVSVCLLGLQTMALSPAVADDPALGRIVDVSERPVFVSSRWGVFDAGDSVKSFAEVGDFNGDGRDDFVISHPSRKILKIYASNGRDGFSAIETPRPGSAGGPIGMGDLDGDGCDDIFLWSQTHHELHRGISDCRSGFTWKDTVILSNLNALSGAAVQENAQERRNELVLLGRPIDGAFVVREKSAEPLPRIILSAVAAGHSRDSARELSGLLADIDGDGRLDLVSPLDYNWRSGFAVTGTADTTQPFVDLLLLSDVPRPIRIELNGDRRDDLLIHSDDWKSLLGWFAVISGREGGLVRSIAMPVPDAVDSKSIRAGDFNGDGFADLLSFLRSDKGRDEIFVSVRTPPRGIEGVTVRRKESGSATMSGAEGEFVLQRGSGEVTFSFEKPGFTFRPNPLVVSERDARFPSVVAAENVSGPGAPTGRATGILADPPGPHVCLGWHPLAPLKSPNSLEDYRTFLKRMSNWGNLTEACPNGYAMLSISVIRRDWKGRLRSEPSGICCRLPSPDVLRDKQVWSPIRCPDGFVITGFEATGRKRVSGKVLCSEVNTDRYQLGPEEPATYWGFAYSMRFEHPRISIAKLPAAFRRGAGRDQWSAFTDHGCSGGTSGGLFVSIDGSTCRERRFRSLQYVGLPGDPPRGTPVPMFPECSVIDDVYDPLSGCH